MNTTVVALKTQITSTRHAVRDESRMRVAAFVMLLIDVALTLWGVSRLQMSVQQWQIQGVITQHLLQLCLFSYIGVAVLTVIGGVQRLLDSDEALVLFTLPLSSGTRFRVLYSSILVGNMWSWMLLEAVVSGYALFPYLGWLTLEWIVLLELGAMFTVLCTILVVLCVIRFLLSDRRWVAWLLSITCVIAIEASILLFAPHIHRLPIAVYLLHPKWYIVVFSIGLVLALGPFANTGGLLYVQTFLAVQRWDRSHRIFMVPGIRAIVNILAKRRTLMSALFTKMLLSQSRNPLAWLRMCMMLLVIALFAPLHMLALHAGWSNMLFVAVYVAVLGIVPVAEQAPCAISGEANRLTLYMVASFNISNFLRVRLIQFLLPSLSIGLIASFICSWQLHLTLGQMIIVIIAMVLLVTGMLTVMVCGSVWDEDMNLAVEGALQTIMQEEGPMTPRRMGVFNLGIAVFVGMVLVLWRVPIGVAFPVLLLIDGGLIFVMWRLGWMSFRKIEGA